MLVMKKWLLLLPLFAFALLALPATAAKTKLDFKILGLKGELLTNVTSQLQLKQKKLVTADNEAINSFYEEIPIEITKTLKPYGYFKTTVVNSPTTHKHKKWSRHIQSKSRTTLANNKH